MAEHKPVSQAEIDSGLPLTGGQAQVRLLPPGLNAADLLELGWLSRRQELQQPWQALGLVVGHFLVDTVRLSPSSVYAALDRMRDKLKEVADASEELWLAGEASIGKTVPRDQLMVADHRYLTWSGFDGFLDGVTGRLLDPLPAPPVTSMTLHLSGAYFRMRAALAAANIIRGNAPCPSQPPSGSWPG